MSGIDNEKRFIEAAGCICQSIGRRIIPLAPRLAPTAQEIRLRLNRPVTIVCREITYFITQNGGLVSTPIAGSMLSVSKSDIADTFHNLCNYSVYTRQNEIVNGFITMRGGHRAGICGTAVMNSDKITNIRDITSINVRIAREHKNCSKTLTDKLMSKSGGVIICGAPCSGKTTVLRDMARIISSEYCKNVSLIDERGEFSGISAGGFQNDIGLCDVFDCYLKSTAMIQAIRSMSPDIIICDEIGSDDDIAAVEQSVNCGVRVIASVHAANERELKRKNNIKKLVSTGAFSTIVFLGGKSKPGEIVKITDVGDVFGA